MTVLKYISFRFSCKLPVEVDKQDTFIGFQKKNVCKLTGTLDVCALLLVTNESITSN